MILPALYVSERLKYERGGIVHFFFVWLFDVRRKGKIISVLNISNIANVIFPYVLFFSFLLQSVGEKKTIPREEDRMTSGVSWLVAIWVTQPVWPTRVPRSLSWSPDMIFFFKLSENKKKKKNQQQKKKRKKKHTQKKIHKNTQIHKQHL